MPFDTRPGHPAHGRRVRTWPAIVVSGLSRTHDDRFQAALTDFDVAAIDETTDDCWSVFFHSRTERDRGAAALSAGFPDLPVAPIDVLDEDWAARSQASLRSIRADNIIVAPPWDVPIVITIQPSMGFGTGHHATTRLCLAALQTVDLQGKTVIDAGTGSGVLAIAASLLGAASVVGIDDDVDAVESAQENLTLNPRARVVLRSGDLRTVQDGRADVVLANLTGALLTSAAAQVQQLTRDRGRLILSGFTEREEALVLSAYPERAVEHRAQEDEWLCVILR